ncbi:MAG: RsmB/NOP family class I SAM-dependent RNA methyltransferase [Parachlamydiales bacterium]|jgi:16S rRNA C967 or C1407 C5-methylase (RsmB/RsmF family)
MEKLPFRDFHLLHLLEDYSNFDRPLDVAICRYFRANKSLGSKDRYEISESAYALVRWAGLLEALYPKAGWRTWLKALREGCLQNPPATLPAHTKVSFPKELFDRIVHSLGEKEAVRICHVCNTPAPTYVRANTIKISRDELLQRWADKYEVSPAKVSPEGIIFNKKIHFFSIDEFKEGLFEVQDEASQLISGLVNATPGNLVMDFCAGAGGKALAIAPRLQGKGQLYLHDIREHALTEAKIRFKRAGAQNVQFLADTSPALTKLKKKMDWVLADVPCSGTGTLRRNPDMKWRYDDELLQRLLGQQRMIFEKALSYLKPDGSIVYATCSLLDEENEMQVEHFLKTYGLKLVGEPFKSIPSFKGMDGFFGAVMKQQ